MKNNFKEYTVQFLFVQQNNKGACCFPRLTANFNNWISKFTLLLSLLTRVTAILLAINKICRFSLVVAHLDLHGKFFDLSLGHTIDFKNGTTAPQPVLVIISLSKGNQLAKHRCNSYLIQQTFRQSWYNSKSWLSEKIKGY